jgi:putative mRNA 3-end processing factor
MSDFSFERWLYPTDQGLYCAPGRFHIDPRWPVDRAVVTHGHSDHARTGHAFVLATVETIAVMKTRLGDTAAGVFQSQPLGHEIRIGDVDVSLHPAGHILGSAQVKLGYQGRTAVVSGDYKRTRDPTCQPFEVLACDLFVTEATFGLPVFRHEPDHGEIAKLLASLAAFPERTHLIGVYGLGKCQRLIMLLRAAGFDRTIWLHGALKSVCDLYETLGISLGPLALVSEANQSLAGEIVMCPPSALRDRWSRRLADPVTSFASGWMRVRARARQRGVELPLIISDHVDWPELVQTITDTGAAEIWVTHGREEALVHQIGLMGKRGRALALVGREDEAE